MISSLSVGGAERVLTLLANRWVEMGWRLTVIDFSKPGTTPFFPLDARVREVQLGLHRVSTNPISRITTNLGRIRILRRAILRTEPDVVLSFMDRTNVLALIATVGVSVPIVVSERSSPRVLDRPWRWLRAVSYRRASVVVTQTGAALDDLPSPLRARGRVIPNPLPEDLAHLPDPDVQPAPESDIATSTLVERVVALGRLTPEKGFDVLIAAFARIISRRPNARLVIWGEGPERENLEQLARDLGVADRVDLPGETRDPAAAIGDATIFVLSSRVEGFPNALLEAMALGRPVIAADCPHGPRDIVRDGIDGILVPPEDPGALADSLIGLLADRTRRMDLARRAVEVRERFALATVAAQWEGLLLSAGTSSTEAGGDGTRSSGDGTRSSGDGARSSRPTNHAEGAVLTDGAAHRRRLKVMYLTGLGVGGAERQMLILARDLPRDQFDVHFVLLGGRNPLAGEARAAGATVTTLGSMTRAGVPRVLFAAEILRRVGRYIVLCRRERYDIVDAWLFLGYGLAAVAKPFAGIPVLVSGRVSLSAYKRSFGRVARAVDELARRRSDAIVANSDAVAQDVARREGIPRDRITVIVNGVEPAVPLAPDRRRSLRAQWGADDESIVVGCVGTMRPGKGHDRVVRIAAACAPQRPGMRVVLVGDGPVRGDLEAQVRELGVEEVVVFHGVEPDARTMYGAFDIVISASDAEGLPNNVLEAAVARRAILATDAGGTREAVLDGITGLLVPVGDEDALVAGLLRLTADAELRRTLGEAAAAHVARTFPVDRLIRETADLYMSLAALKGRPRP